MQIPSKHNGFTRDGVRRVFLGGGEKSTPEPMATSATTTTTQGPTYSSGTSSTTTQNKIPSWLESTSQSMLQRANTLSQTPYVPYGGERVAGFDPMMEQAFGRIGGQGVASQIGQASGLAGLAGERAMTAGNLSPYETGRFAGETAQQYMDPYMQNVVNTQLREAQRQADIAATTRAGAATRAGAFGGSRQAIMDAEAQRNLATQMGDIQATGLQKAYETGRTQFNVEDALREQARLRGAELGIQGSSQALQAAQALGQLGQTQFGQEMDITQGLGYAGALRQQQEQAMLDVAYQDFLAKQKYPYEQISWLQGIAAGSPHSTTQISNTRQSGVTTPGAQTTTGLTTQETMADYQARTGTAPAAPAATANVPVYSQLAQGGIVGYAEGGITGLLTDQQLKERQKVPTISTLAKMAVEKEMSDRAMMRQAAMGQPQAPRPTVAEEEMAGIAALPVREDLVPTAANGGIVGFEKGGYVPFYEQAYRQGETKGSIYDEYYGLSDAERRAREAAEAERRAAFTMIPMPEGQEMSNPLESILGGAKALAADLNYNEDAARAKAKYEAEQAAKARVAGAERSQKILERQGLGAAPPAPAVPTVAKGRGQIPPGADKGLGGTEEAQRMAGTPAAAPAAQQQGGLGAFQEMLDKVNKPAEALVDRAAAMEQEEQNAALEAEKNRYGAAQARADAAKTADEPTREALRKRAEKLEGAADNAIFFALLRGLGTAALGKGRSKGANLGYGLLAGVESYAGDMDKIDQAQEKVRMEVAKLDELRAKAAEASGKELEEMQSRIQVQTVKAKNAGEKLRVAAGLKRLDAEGKAQMEYWLNLDKDARSFGYDIQKIRATGEEARKTQASKPPATTAANTRGQITEKDLASERSKAASEWDKSFRLRKQYPSKDAYVQDRLRVFTGQTDNAGAASVPTAGFGAMTSRPAQ